MHNKIKDNQKPTVISIKAIDCVTISIIDISISSQKNIYTQQKATNHQICRLHLITINNSSYGFFGFCVWKIVYLDVMEIKLNFCGFWLRYYEDLLFSVEMKMWPSDNLYRIINKLRRNRTTFSMKFRFKPDVFGSEI